jgi:hypothetical protein
MDSQAGGEAAPTIVNSTVARTREYLTGSEVEALMAAARKSSRYRHRDATMIFIAYRHAAPCGPRRHQRLRAAADLAKAQQLSSSVSK